MDVKDAVVAAEANNRHWMRTHVGIVEFIISECELENEGNDEYDNVILRNPEEARREAKVLDAQGHPFRAQISLVIPESSWDRAYGHRPNAESVKEFLQNALFVGTDHITVSVDSIVDENE